MTKQRKEELFKAYFEFYIQDTKMTKQQRNELFIEYLKHCIDTINQNTKAEKRAAMLKNLQTIHETDNIITAFNAMVI